MSAELIYRTTSPAAEAWWRAAEAKLEQQRVLRNAFEDEMLATYGPSRVPKYNSGFGRRALMTNGRVATGLHSGYHELPPANSGWRLDSKDHYWKPALRTPEGKAWEKRLAELTVYIVKKHVHEIGIPELAWGDNHIYWAGLEHDNEPFALYQVWGSGRCAADCETAQAQHPEVEWVEVPRSRWYAREEALKQASA